MSQHLITGSQTIGPFFKYGLAWEGGEHVFPAAASGRRVTLSGKVVDGAGATIEDALIEVWQPAGDGRFGGPVKGGCAGWGRIPTDPQGRFTIHTMMPGAVAGPRGEAQAPHLFVCIFARGLLKHLFTRVYFDGEAANAGDPILALAGGRASTMIAGRTAEGAYTWDIVLQGAGETVFFDI